MKPSHSHCTLEVNNIATRPETKHILRKFNYVREQQVNDVIKVVKIANPADFFTKILDNRLSIPYRKWRERFLR